MELTPFQNSLSRGATASDCFVSSGLFWQPLEAIKSTFTQLRIHFLCGGNLTYLMCLFAGAAELGATTEEPLWPVTGELVTLYFKAMHCYKEELCHRGCSRRSPGSPVRPAAGGRQPTEIA